MNTRTTSEHTAWTAAVSRRRDIRLEPPRAMRAQLAGLDEPAAVHDISLGGVSLFVPKPLGLRTVHVVTLMLGPVVVQHRARVAHCWRGSNNWRVGMAFVDRPLRGSSTVEELINAVLQSAISFS